MENRLDGMGEQSHKEAMREAIRGDLERARSRRPTVFERAAPPPVEIRELQGGSASPEQTVEPQPEPAPEAVSLRRFPFWRR